MGLFLSTYTNKVDKKGRVSVPAQFRNSLAAQPFAGIVSYVSFVNPCIESCGMDRIEKLSESINQLDPFSEVHDAFATTILGSCVQLPFDPEGRVILPENFLNGAGITENAVFVGKGITFEIWSPERFAAHSTKQREVALKNRLSLTSAKSGEGK